jgi:hypothetical protein
MNQKTMTYVILICMIFISLGIGMYWFNIQEGATGGKTNSGVSVNVGESLRDDAGHLVLDTNGRPIKIIHLNSKGIVDKCDPDIKLDENGYAIRDKSGLPSKDGTLGNVIMNDKPGIFDTTYGTANKDSAGNTKYLTDDAGNKIKDEKGNFIVDTQYHETAEQIAAESDYQDLQDGTVYVSNQDGELVAIPKSNVQGSITYYQPDSYRFGASTYVPNYEDSVYLSRTTGQTTVTTFSNPVKMYGGVCTYYKDQPAKLEEACQKMDADTCASTSCCVLLGGKKCVSGNEQGPTVRSNYSDVYVPNRDFYYYQGKCYGNCP